MPISEQLDKIGLTGMLPSVSKGAISTILVWIAGSILLAIIICGVVILLFYHLMYNQRVKLFKKIGDKIIPVSDFKARFIKIGKAGDRQFYIRGIKKYLPTPTIQMGKNIFWFYEREDGEWINFSLQDFDKIMKKAGAFYVDFDMRMSRIGIEKNLGERLMKQSFWDKYGATLMNIMAFLIICVALVIFFWQLNKLMGSLNGLVGALQGYIDAFNNIVQQQGGIQEV